MSDMGDDFQALREHNREYKEYQREKRTRQLLEMQKEGFQIVRLTDYQFRVNDRLDVWVTWGKWHDIKTGKRGEFRGTNTKEFVRGWFAEGR